MADKDTAPPTRNRRRAAIKALLVIAGVTAVLLALLTFVSRDEIEALKFTLDVWTLVALVLIINLAGILVGALMFAAWKWVKADLDPEED